MSLEDEYLFSGEKRKRRFHWRSLLLALVGAIVGGLIVVLVVPYLLGSNPVDFFSSRTQKTVVKIKPKEEIVTGKFFLDPVVAVSKVAGPSVVSIRVAGVSVDSFFGPMQQKAEGSGVIYRSDGYVITNNHVVENAKSITVVLPNGARLKGKLIGRDPVTDIAVVKVDRTGLTAAKLGDSDELQVGELAVAIGNPFEFEHTVTAGVISALKRNIRIRVPEGSPRAVPRGPFEMPLQTETSKPLENLIQTDAAINPGNSGGALCNKKGEVIGIPSVIFTPSSGSVGIGFATPSNDAKTIADQLIKTGKVSHPWIGIGGATLTPEIAQELKTSAKEGVVVVQVFRDQPAQLAGVKQGDIINGLNDKKIKSIDQLTSTVRDMKVGQEVTISVIRKNSQLSFKLKLAEIPKKIQLQQ